METSETKRRPYLAPLDGIRAVAIMAVLVFHISPGALQGGFTGVDVFFVLSGFLITSIILHDIRAGSFSITEFYLRRIQRLLPNIIATVLAVLVLWAYFLPPNAAAQPGRHGLWTLFNLSNVYIWRDLGSYWGDAAEWAPLTHFWSLGIEEQFYLIFPATLLLLTRLRSGRMQLWLGLAAAASFVICWYGTRVHPQATFYLLPTRVWELLLGAMLAVHLARLRAPGERRWFAVGPQGTALIGWVGLGMIALGFVVIGSDRGFPGLSALLPTMGTILVLLSVTAGETSVSRFLATPFLVGTGKLSYSLYLWHWPLITFGKLQASLHGLPERHGAVAGGVAGILLGWGAYVWIERPLRERGPGRTWRLGTIAGGFATAVLACAFFATRQTAVDPNRLFDTPTFTGRLFDTHRATRPDPPTPVPVCFSDVYFPPIPIRADGGWRTGGIIHRFGGGDPSIVVLGSSHALMYARMIDDLCRQMKISVAFLSVGEGTSVFFGNGPGKVFSSASLAQEFDDIRRRYLREWRPVAVFALDRWDLRASTSEDFDSKLRSFLNEVSPLTGRVILAAQVPVAEQGDKNNLRAVVTWRMGPRKDLPRIAPDSREPLRREIVVKAEAAATDFPNLRVLRADLPFYRDNGSVRYAEGRRFFYADDDHLTEVGADEVRTLFRNAIAEALAGDLFASRPMEALTANAATVASSTPRVRKP